MRTCVSHVVFFNFGRIPCHNAGGYTYAFAPDLADAHLRAVDFIGREEGFHIFNLGNGAGYTVRQVIEAVQRVSGKTVPVTYGDRRAGDAPALVADSAKAREVLGWRPAMPALDDIVGTAWRWHEARQPAVGRGVMEAVGGPSVAPYPRIVLHWQSATLHSGHQRGAA